MNLSLGAKWRGWTAAWNADRDTDRFSIASLARGRVRLARSAICAGSPSRGSRRRLFLVHFGLNYRLPFAECMVAIAMSALLNVGLAVRYPATHRLTNREATFYLAYDIVQLAALLYLTGGIENPFALMFLAPVVIAASTLDLGNTLILAGLAFVSVSAIAVRHAPLPWAANEPLPLPPLYLVGIWASLVIGIGFMSIYAWRIASESARMQAGLAGDAIGAGARASSGLARCAGDRRRARTRHAARHHRRRRPRTRTRAAADSPEAEDVRLLRAQAERCRGILTRLARPEESALGAADRLPLGALLDEIANDYRGGDIEISIELDPGGDTEPKVWRVPELIHGLGNIVANAADFAASRVQITARWTHGGSAAAGGGRRAGLRAGDPRADRRALCHLPAGQLCAGRYTSFRPTMPSPASRAWDWAFSSPKP